MRLKTAAAVAALWMAGPTLALAAPQTYTIEKTHVDVAFEVNHLGFSQKHGQFRDIAGTLILDADKPQAATVDVTIKAASIDTGFGPRDKDLTGPNFFDAVQFPDLHFVSTAVKQTGPDTADITGDLTIHGVTKPVVLKTKLNKLGVNVLDKRPTVGFSATAAVKRSDFGIKTFLPLIGDDVSISIEAEFNRPAPAAK